MPHDARPRSSRLCNRCVNYVFVPFTVGRCGRLAEETSAFPSITEERAELSGWRGGYFRCGRDGYWYEPGKRKHAAHG